MSANKNTDVLNENIKAEFVRLISESGEQLGVVKLKDALFAAKQENLDLVMMASNVVPPVVKLIDYGKFSYSKHKKEKEIKKKSRVQETKEIRLTPSIDTNDLGVKLRQAIEFLERKDRVLVTMKFKGREVANMGYAMKTLHEIMDKLSAVGNIETQPKLENKRMSFLVSPSKG